MQRLRTVLCKERVPQAKGVSRPVMLAVPEARLIGAQLIAIKLTYLNGRLAMLNACCILHRRALTALHHVCRRCGSKTTVMNSSLWTLTARILVSDGHSYGACSRSQRIIVPQLPSDTCALPVYCAFIPSSEDQRHSDSCTNSRSVVLIQFTCSFYLAASL